MILFILQSGGNAITSFMPLVLMAVVVYFFFIRPQTKRQKEQKTFLEELEKGDEIVTSSGIVGRIKTLDEHFVQIDVGNKTFMKLTRGSISKEMTEAVVSAGTAKKEEKV